MRPHQPPAAATWLLEHCTFRPRNASLVGDLAEEYRGGRSNMWYWCQALAALASNLAKGLRTQPFYVIRGLFTGWLVLYLSHFVSGHFIGQFFFLKLGFRYPLVFGNPNWPPDGLFFWFLWVASGLFTGWLVARLHRSEAAPIVFLFSASVLFWNLRSAPWLYTLVVESFTSSRYIPYLVTFFFGVMLATPVSVMLGGMYGLNNESAAEEDHRPAVL